MRALTTAAVVALGLALGACGDDGGSTASSSASTAAGQPPSTSAAAPKPGTTGSSPAPSGGIAGTGYTVSPPPGWKDRTKQAATSAIRFDAVLLEPNPTDDFANNINVIREAVGDVPVDELVKAQDRQIKSLGAKIVKRSAQTKLDGDAATQLTATSAPGQTVQQLQVPHDGAVYTVTLTSREPEPKLFDAFLGSWKWSSVGTSSS